MFIAHIVGAGGGLLVEGCWVDGVVDFTVGFLLLDVGVHGLE